MTVPSSAIATQPRAEGSSADASADFRRLVERHRLRVWRSLRYLGVREADLPDASQEVFLVVHRKLAEFRGDSKQETWLYGICLGIARNIRRKQLRAAPVEADPADEIVEPTQDTEVDRERLRARLRAALDQIQPEQREVFVLHEIEELDMRSIARAVGCPLFTAYSRLRLARRHLARRLEPHRSGRP